MHIQIIEIKARCTNQARIRAILQEKGADFRGTDHQVDTYFKVNHGRLKLREGDIENNLIHYQRADQQGPKQSEVLLFRSAPGSTLKAVLTEALGVLTTVDKQREIYFLDHVKFHIDTVQELGTFIEVEAIDEDGTIGITQLQKNCQHYLDLFAVAQADLVAGSYSDLMLQKKR